ncbi:hypothetical protein INT43_006589 [Umbelopsis isabellina]|uniref:Protein BIG1 n=1 Tax=Mortierella isabellina TaxID=91625 RepID=A0A8H7Q1E1_MORIS|nr:hypothetical protein INT43_006589 [Umbelopsis isabellina]
MKLLSVLLPIALVSAVSAFENTVPCLAWSPKSFTSVSGGSHDQYVVLQKDAIDKILSPFGSELCQTKVIAIVDQPKIHSSDFSHYSESMQAIKAARLQKHSSDAATRIQHQYIDSHVDIDKMVGKITQRCESTLAVVDSHGKIAENRLEDNTKYIQCLLKHTSTNTFTDVSNGVVYSQEGNTVALLELPEALSESLIGKHIIDALVEDLITTIKQSVGDDYIVIFTSSSAKVPMHSKRSTFEKRAPSNQNAPIFQKYQLFNTGIFMAIAVSALFIGILIVGVSWLGSIQTPMKFEGKTKRS